MKIENSGSIKNTFNKVPTKNINNDFSYNLKIQTQNHNKEVIDNLILDIQKKGNLVKKSKRYDDLRDYKKKIGSYLKSIQGHMYTINKQNSLFEDYYFTVVDIIDKSLEELTALIIKEQKENIDIICIIDKIQGLLLEIYI